VPVVICDGSGRASDLLAFAHQYIQEDGLVLYAHVKRGRGLHKIKKNLSRKREGTISKINGRQKKSTGPRRRRLEKCVFRTAVVVMGMGIGIIRKMRKWKWMLLIILTFIKIHSPNLDGCPNSN
jgi:hypothetical protein